MSLSHRLLFIVVVVERWSFVFEKLYLLEIEWTKSMCSWITFSERIYCDNCFPAVQLILWNEEWKWRLTRSMCLWGYYLPEELHDFIGLLLLEDTKLFLVVYEAYIKFIVILILNWTRDCTRANRLGQWKVLKKLWYEQALNGYIRLPWVSLLKIIWERNLLLLQKKWAVVFLLF